VSKDQTEQVTLDGPDPGAWRKPALLAVALLVAGGGLLWASGRMAPPPAAPEVVPPPTPPAAASAGPASAPRAASLPAAAVAAAATAVTPRPAATPTPPAAATPTPAAGATAATPTGATPTAAPTPAPAAPAPTPGAATPIIQVKGSAVMCFEPQADEEKAVGQPCTNQQLRGRLLDHKAEIESCLAAVPAGKRSPRGTIALRARWSLGDPPAGGKLARVRPLRDAPKDPAFLACVKEELARMHVKPGVCPRCYAEMTVTISY
jgi:hypothetical protein